MEAPDHLKYTPNHEWVRTIGNRAVIGITDFAQEELGMIVFAELPHVGDELKIGAPLGSTESIKTVTEVLAPLSGKVVAVNTLLGKMPSRINQSPYDQGWLVEIEVADPAELETLWDATKYADVYGHE
ncbi:glycine cleavage system protein GcvH [Paenibacillus sp. N1-5-1-14]|uniref:glycine cleavage system protein GcvH n=1 Tax=Paenibacillus radicibacter TaxID=2972488 RepID=UPI0021596C86|nr:glycine cleavage system protein GcvH [Paenibacillus radicibacter]MCR8645659.1 glycine cleavage system protein GcvH [Paenibacillus radicibacter]